MNVSDILQDPKLKRRVLRQLQDSFAEFVDSETSAEIFKRAQETIMLLVIAEAEGDGKSAQSLRDTLALDKDLVALRAKKAGKALARSVLFSLVGAVGRVLGIALKGKP